jgi:SAM-dependent methyltransferase
MNTDDHPLVRLGKLLQARNYAFVTVTPDTHLRVLARQNRGITLRDIFGWNKVFHPADLHPEILQCVEGAGEAKDTGDGVRSGIRASTLGGQLFLHSAFPTSAEDAVFFGPDSYRFVRLIEEVLKGVDTSKLKHAADIGCGSGVGGIAVRRLIGETLEVTLSDINESALRFARLNCKINDLCDIRIAQSDVLSGLPDTLDLIVSNPPYLVDTKQRLYRHGGGPFGFDLSVRIVDESIQHLRTGGSLILYTGTVIVDGHDLLREALKPVLSNPYLSTSYSEIDPDVFATELEWPPYHFADRIAVVALHLAKR